MDNVALLPGADVPPTIVLEKAKEWGLKSVVIVGEDTSGGLVYGMSIPGMPEIVFLLESAKRAILEEAFK